MPSKYDKLKGKVPSLRKANGGSHDERVNRRIVQLRESLNGANIGELGEAYAVTYEAREQLKAQMSELQVDIDALQQIIFEKYEAEGITSSKLPGGGSISVNPKPYPKMVDREAFRQWCLDNGYEREMHLHSSTTASIVADLLLKGEPVPAGIEAFLDDQLTFRRGKGGAADEDE